MPRSTAIALSEGLARSLASRRVVVPLSGVTSAVFVSDRVLVMSPRPGCITKIINTDLLYPRVFETREEPRYFEMVNEVRELLRDAHGG